MAPLSKSAARKPKRVARVRASRRGTITLVTLIAILGMVVLMGFVGNAGHVVTTKVNTQNAADAIAFSSAQWMARGMNAVTATNHLLGEVTGLVVVIEGLGGPEADEGLEDYPLEPKMFDQFNQKLKDKAKPQGGYGASAYGSVEGPILKAIVDMVSPEKEDKAKFRAFATIYDSEVILKRNLGKYLLIKAVANIGFLVPPPFGWGTAIAAYVAHAASSYEIALIAKEYVILEGLELVATNVRFIKVTLLEDQLIPALAAHGDFIAGRGPKASKFQAGIVNTAMVDTLAHLEEVYKVEVETYPSATKLPIPIEPEPAPSLKGSTKNEPEWGTDESLTNSIGDVMEDLQESVDDQKDEIDRRIIEIRLSITGALGQPVFGFNVVPQEGLDKLERDLDNLLETELAEEDRAKTVAELGEIRKLKTEKLRRIAELEKEKAKLQQGVDEMKKTLAEAKSVVTTPGNLSIAHIPKEMNQAEERYTQWVRATYPYVDAFRAPILAQFEEHLEESEAARHYRKWTDRFTLTKAWKFRSGYHFEKTGKNKGEWKKASNAKPLVMYVMKDAIDKGTGRLNKGREKWALDTKEGKQRAEELFTVIGMTHRELKPLFSPVIYPLAMDNGVTTFAQAVYYNANEQKPAPVGATDKLQPKVGWDTLNWDPNVATPDWGHEPSRSKAKWPWEIFTSSPDLIGTAGVRLNWQAKLMPVTRSRFAEATAASLTDPSMTANMVDAMLFFDPLVTH